jgi:uncharacterized protein
MPTMLTFLLRGLLAAALLLGPMLTSAADTAPTDASIRELLEVTEARKLIDNVSGQLDTAMRDSMAQALGDAQLTDAQRQILDEMRQRFVAVMTDEMSWTRYEPLLFNVYRQSFTQAEVDGMLAFYRTDAGRAVIAKMPTVMQNTMQLVQQQMAQVMPKLQQIQQDAAAKLEASKSP